MLLVEYNDVEIKKQNGLYVVSVSKVWLKAPADYRSYNMFR